MRSGSPGKRIASTPGTRGVARMNSANRLAWPWTNSLACEMFWIKNHEEDIVAADRTCLGLAAPAAGKAPRPELQDQRQAEALVRLGAPERKDRAQRRFVEHRRIRRRLALVVQQPPSGNAR